MSVSPEKRAKRAARGKRQRGGKADGADEEVNADGLIDDGADASFNPNEGRLGAPKRARGNTNSNNSSGKKHQPGSKSKSSNSHVKDPEEAAEYLRQWQLSKQGKPSSWRFNKSTQSWLLRHMYKRDRVAKEPFKVSKSSVQQLAAAAGKGGGGGGRG